MYGGTEVSDFGEEEPAGNFNFNSNNVSDTKWYIEPTIINDGIYIAQTWILTAQGHGASTAEGSILDLDVVLTPNTNFLLRFTNATIHPINVFFETNYKES